MAGIFITFEGGEGSGKTTVISRVKEKLESLGFNVVTTREPGGSEIAEQIRQVILDKANTMMCYKTEALLYAASRHQHLQEIIIPNLNKGNVVLCDRYLDSSLAYQGHARGLGIDEVYEINKYAIDGILPAKTIYFDLAPEVGLNRIKTNNRNENRLDVEKINFHELVREGYLILADKFKDRIQVINANQSKDEVYNDVLQIVLDVVNK